MLQQSIKRFLSSNGRYTKNQLAGAIQRQTPKSLHAFCPFSSSTLNRKTRNESAWHAHQIRSQCFSSTSTSQVDHHEFQAETRQLLDIVTHSIYTDKEVFVRELISNASDALEKLRHLQATGENILNPEIEPKIVITTDENENTISILDTGVGMKKAELIDNLGTIARSGSKAFLDQIKSASSGESSAAASGIIGKFGVGFYSGFMVADKIQVVSRSALDGECHVWQSDGSGSFEIRPCEENETIPRGCKIIINLKDTCKEFAKSNRIESIIRQYSNFVSFPISVNDKIVNTIQALWTKSESKVTDKEYSEFYKFVANAFDEPLYRLNFRTDAPIELKTLLFVGSTHTEKFGNAYMQPGVSVYSRKVLIERNSNNILPEWLRFMRGVVDSEDLPLSLSRETMQDSRMVQKIKDVLVRRIVRFFQQQAIKEPEKYNQFYKDFNAFIKEGVCTDFKHKTDLAKLLRYESSHLESGTLCSLDEYLSRSPPDQEEIYYLCSPSRALAEASPYYELFKKANKEVLFVTQSIDDFVMTNLTEYNGRKIIAAEKAKLDLETSQDDETTPKLSEVEQKEFFDWLGGILQENVKEVRATTRLTDSPAVISDHDSSALRRMMNMVNHETGQAMQPLSKHNFEINPRHPIVLNLNRLRRMNLPLAEKVARQVYDNAAVAAGLVDDGRTLLTNMNALLDDLLNECLADKR
uniref:Heat shock protein 75 kDa putative n=1 Tax=Albugo laibachii Nc14 TaxID=890382 RepID=F0W888_9STRA|nr:heat shock protein 75 kDa putative [Albugo laibachii Nc14]|eukprot:CCA17288.1 heat shock protein 75 kDa putative [Albugo laibachii Nc14]